jgi:hypothetical protein
MLKQGNWLAAWGRQYNSQNSEVLPKLKGTYAAHITTPEA